MANTVHRTCARCGSVLPATARSCPKCSTLGACEGGPTKLSGTAAADEDDRLAEEEERLRAQLADQQEGIQGYKILRFAARGGMGVVYQAEHTALNRKVALKILPAAELVSERVRERFRVEAEAVAQLEHPHIVPIYDVGTWKGNPFIAMKWVEGRDFHQWMQAQRGQLPDSSAAQAALVRRAVQLLVQVAQAVHHAHQRGFLHRDLKPSNILIDAEDTPYVTDFGIARRMKGTDDITLSGEIVGTPTFMSPEQARGDVRSLSVATDIFNLGALLYWLIVGEPPFTGETALEIIRKLNDEEPARPSTIIKRADRDLEIICLKCLRKEPAGRYPSALALAQDLERWLRHEPIEARPQSDLERVVSFCRRKPVLAGLMGSTAVLLVAFLIHLLLSQSRLEMALAGSRGRQEIEAMQRRVAEQERNKAVAANESLSGHLFALRQKEADSHLAAGETAAGIAGLAQLVREHPSEPALAARLADELALRPFARRLDWTLPHPAPVTQLCYSPDGALLATGCQDGRLRVFQTATGQPLIAPVAVGTNRVDYLEFGMQGSVLVAGAGHEFAIIETHSGKELRRGRKDIVNTLVSLSPNGRYLAVSRDRRFHILDLTEDREILNYDLTPSTQRIWTGDSTRFLNSGLWGRFYVYSIEKRSRVTNELAYRRSVASFAFDSTNTRLLTVGHGEFATLWDLETGEKLREFSHPEQVNTAAIQTNRHLIATGDNAGNIRVWSGTNYQLAALSLKCGDAIRALQFSGDGARLCVATGQSDSGHAQVYSLADGRRVLEGIRWRKLFACSPRFETVSTLVADDTVGLWSLVSPNESVAIRQLPDYAFFQTVLLSRDERFLAFATGQGIAALADAADITKVLMLLPNRFGPPGPGLRMHPQGTNWLAFDRDKALTMGTRGNRSWVAQSPAGGQRLIEAAYDSSGEDVIGVRANGASLIADLKGGNKRPFTHPPAVWAQYDPREDQLHLLTGTGSLLRLDPREPAGGRAWPLGPQTLNWTARTVTADGRWFCGIGPDQSLRLHWLAGEAGAAIKIGDVAVSGFTFDDSAASLLVITSLGEGRILHLSSNRVERSVPLLGSQLVAGRFVCAGRLLVTISRHQQVQFWDTVTGRPGRAAIPLSRNPACLAATRDGRRVYVGDDACLTQIDIPDVEVPANAAAWLPQFAESLVAARRLADGRLKTLPETEVEATLTTLAREQPQLAELAWTKSWTGKGVNSIDNARMGGDGGGPGASPRAH